MEKAIETTGANGVAEIPDQEIALQLP